MKKLLIFGGTSEEHDLLEALSPFSLKVTLCVASDYGEMMLPAALPGLTVHRGRLDQNQIATFIRQEGFFCVVDATHPYATAVTVNIKAAAAETGIAYLRLLRNKSNLSQATEVSSIQEAINILNLNSNNVLLTTGSKELAAFTAVESYQSRLFPRVLPTVESITACLELGYPANHIIAMHGPFSKELNVAMMRQLNIKTLVTKDGGAPGGFPEKLEAAKELGAEILVISRPPENGLSLGEVVAALSKLLEELK